MTKAEVQRWANKAAADFIERSWDQCDWDEKVGHDADRLDMAFEDIVAKLRRLGPLPGDRKPAD